MSYRRVSQIVLVVLTGVLIACGADQTNPTAPDLGGLASLTSEAPGGGKGKPPKDDGGEQTLYTHFALSGGFETAAGVVFDVVRQEVKKGILRLGGLAGAVRFSTHFVDEKLLYPVDCLVTIGNKEITDPEDKKFWEERLLKYLVFGPLVYSWGMTVDLNILGVESDGKGFGTPSTASGYLGEEENFTNIGILTHATFGGVTATKTTSADGTKDIFTFEGGRIGVVDRSGTLENQNVWLLCRHTTTITVTLTRAQ